MNPKEAVSSLSHEERQLAELMERTQKGDHAACEALLIQVETMVYPYLTNALRRVGIEPQGRAEDIVQEVLLGVYAKRDTFEPGYLFLPWMYAIARYKLIDNLRTTKGNRAGISLDALLASSVPISPESSLAATLDVEALLKALPEKQRVLLGLVKLEGFSSEEAAAHTGVSVSDVKVSVHRALKRLRKMWGGK